MPYTAPFGWIGGPSNTGLTLTATITAIGGAELASGVSVPEAPASSGTYVTSYASFSDGTSYRVDFFSAATYKGSTIVSPADAAVTPAVPGDAMALDLSQAVPTTNTAETVGDALNAARAQAFGRWAIVGTVLTLYAADGTTPVRVFTLDSASAPTSRT